MAQRVRGAPGTRVSDREASGEDDEPMISCEVDDEAESESDADISNEEEHAAQENALVVYAPESTQDTPGPRWFRSEPEIYAAKCNTCSKWREIPSKERYEVIGERNQEMPFVCGHAQEWRDNISCDVPADLEDNDDNVLWVLDKHGIPRSPTGFNRQTIIRTDNPRSQFADVYYKAPCGKTLNSMVQVRKYLECSQASSLLKPPKVERHPVYSGRPLATSKSFFDSKSKVEKTGSHPMAVKWETEGLGGSSPLRKHGDMTSWDSSVKRPPLRNILICSLYCSLDLGR